MSTARDRGDMNYPEILYLGDDELFNEVIAITIRKWGFSVDIFNDANAAFDTLEKQSSQYKVFILNYKKFSSSIKLLQSLSQRDYFGIKNIVLFHSMEENGRNKLLAMVPNAEERVICIPAGEREIIKTYLEVKTLRPFANIFRVTHV